MSQGGWAADASLERNRKVPQNADRHPGIEQDMKRKQQIWSVMNRSDDAALQYLLKILKNEREPMTYRIEAAKSLARMPHPHAPLSLTLGIRANWPYPLRQAIVRSVGEQKVMAGLPALLGLILEEGAQHRLELDAIHALGKFHEESGEPHPDLPPEVVPAMWKAFHRMNDPELQHALLGAFGTLRQPSVVPELWRVIQSRGPGDKPAHDQVRAKAAEVLGWFVDADMIPMCEQVLRQETARPVRREFITFLGRMSGLEAAGLMATLLSAPFDPRQERVVEEFLDLFAALRDRTMYNMDPLPDAYGEVLLKVLNADDGTLMRRASVGHVLSQLTEPQRHRLIIKLLESPIDSTRQHAMIWARESGDSAVMTALVKAAEREPDVTTQVLMIQAIGELKLVGDASAVAALERLSRHPHEGVRGAAVEALAKWGIRPHEELFQSK